MQIEEFTATFSSKNSSGKMGSTSIAPPAGIFFFRTKDEEASPVMTSDHVQRSRPRGPGSPKFRPGRACIGVRLWVAAHCRLHVAWHIAEGVELGWLCRLCHLDNGCHGRCSGWILHQQGRLHWRWRATGWRTQLNQNHPDGHGPLKINEQGPHGLMNLNEVRMVENKYPLPYWFVSIPSKWRTWRSGSLRMVRASLLDASRTCDKAMPPRRRSGYSCGAGGSGPAK